MSVSADTLGWPIREKLIHIWFESNLVNFEFPECLNAVSGSSQPPYLKIGVEFSLTKNVPFSKISVKI